MPGNIYYIKENEVKNLIFLNKPMCTYCLCGEKTNTFKIFVLMFIVKQRSIEENKINLKLLNRFLYKRLTASYFTWFASHFLINLSPI